MRVVHGFAVAPGCCFHCRRSGGAANMVLRAIDFERDQDISEKFKRNHIYVCEDCVTDAFQRLDSSKAFIDKGVLATLEGENVSLTNEVLRLRDEREALDSMIAKAVIAEQASVDA